MAKTLIKDFQPATGSKSEQLDPADHINHGDAGIYDMFCTNRVAVLYCS